MTLNVLGLTAGFLAGAGTSFGPCVAPRFLAICSIAGESSGRQRACTTGAFIAGIGFGTLLLAYGTVKLAAVAAASSYVYGVLAAALAFSGIRALIDADRCGCTHKALRLPLGGAFFLGTAMTLVISPCCTPVIVSIGAIAAGTGRTFAGLLIVAFLAGHLFPLIVAGFGTNGVRRALELRSFAMPVQVVAGALALAMSGYYALLV